jgi:uncharacterized RDD family membrane protein YckC
MPPPRYAPVPGQPVPYGYPPPPGYAVPPPAYRMVLPPMSPGGKRLADFGDRLLAFIIDAVIVGALIAVVTIPVYITLVSYLVDLAEPAASSVDPFAVIGPVLATVAVVLVLALGLTYVYEVEAMYKSGQTIGKRTMKLRIVPLDPARALTRQMAFKRYLVQHVATILVPGLNWIDGLWQLWDKPYRQCLHDKFAETVVIKLDA